jgi:hypothetical protein
MKSPLFIHINDDADAQLIDCLNKAYVKLVRIFKTFWG